MKKIIALLFMGIFLIGTLTGCGSTPSDNTSSEPAGASVTPSDDVSVTSAPNDSEPGSVVVGSKGFTEAFLLSKLYSLALENAGYEVKREYNISTPHDVLVAGDIDIYPEYTSTVILNYLDGEIPDTDDAIYEKVKKGEEDSYNIAVLNQTDVNDKTCLVMLKSRAAELGISNISDLQKNSSGLKLADFYGWSSRTDNLPRLETFYGDFDLVDLDAGLKYDALDQGEVDVIPGNTTEAQLLDTDNYIVLEEDIPVWPDYYVIPLVRQEVLEKHADIADIINAVGSSLDTATMQKLIKQVDIDGEDYEDVAKDFFEKNIK